MSPSASCRCFHSPTAVLAFAVGVFFWVDFSWPPRPSVCRDSELTGRRRRIVVLCVGPAESRKRSVAMTQRFNQDHFCVDSGAVALESEETVASC